MRTLLPQSPSVNGEGPVSAKPMLGALEAEAKMPPESCRADGGGRTTSGAEEFYICCIYGGYRIFIVVTSMYLPFRGSQSSFLCLEECSYFILWVESKLKVFLEFLKKTTSWWGFYVT